METINYENKGRVLFEILGEKHSGKLVYTVQKYLNVGWRLYGPTYEYDGYICQSMWCYETE